MLPYSLELLSDCLPGLQVPTEPFDPDGEWDRNYALWAPARAKTAKSEPLGSLRIRRRLTPRGDVRLNLTRVTKMNGTNGSGITKCVVICAKDDLATPIRWELDSEILDPKGKQVKYSAISISGEADNGIIVLHGEKDYRMKGSGRLTSNWSLFDALQRMPFDVKPAEFDMLEDLELLKPDQTLYRSQSAEVELGGRTVKLHSFEHVGWGILPWTYWLDDNHRLVIAVGQRHAFLIDSASTGEGGAK